MTTSTIQVFQNLQNVNQSNMNLFYEGKDAALTGYTSFQPCICSGIGNLQNKFAQVGTTNVFNFLLGTVRFLNQPTVLSSTDQVTIVPIATNAVTIIASASPPAQLYVVAALTQTQLDAYKVQNTCVISPVALTLAQIAAKTNPLAWVPLFAITRTGSVYVVSIDGSCAYNYNYFITTTNLVDQFSLALSTVGGKELNIYTQPDGFKFQMFDVVMTDLNNIINYPTPFTSVVAGLQISFENGLAPTLPISCGVSRNNLSSCIASVSGVAPSITLNVHILAMGI